MKTLLEYINESSKKCNAFIILKPEFLDHTDEWIEMINKAGWEILNQKQLTMTPELAQELYVMHADKDFYSDLWNYMSSGDCLCAICHKDCDDPIGDMKKLKDKVRKIWGKDDMKNAMHSSDTIDNVDREYKLIFG